MRVGAILVLLAFVAVAWTQSPYEGINTGEGLQSLFFPGNGGIELQTTPERATLSQSLGLSFTFEAWVMLPNPPADGNYKTIVSRWDISRNRDAHNRWADFNLQVQASGTLNLFFGNGGREIYGAIVSASNMVQGVWARVAFSIAHNSLSENPTVVRLFYDDFQYNVTWETGSRQYLPNRSVFLGDYFNQDQDHKWFVGYMDEVRFWSGVRTDAQLAYFRQRVVPADSSNLVAYYRFNDGAGLTIQDSTPNKFDGQLNKVTAATTHPLWRVSGAKIFADVKVAPGSISTIYLPGFSPSGAMAFDYVIESLPFAGSTLAGIGRLLADGEIITTTPFTLISNQVSFEAPNTPGVIAQFRYYGQGRNGGAKEASSTSVFVQIGDIPCQTDACGKCNGDNSTCSCLPLPYNGYNLADVQRILLLYEIEQTLALLDGLQGKITTTIKLLTSHQVTELQTIINEVQLFSSSCLLAFCDNIQKYLDALAAIGPQ